PLFGSLGRLRPPAGQGHGLGLKVMIDQVLSHTYVDPLFGSLGRLRPPAGQGHGLGLKVMIDQVLSHT
ncbi:hypothetical protein C7E18_24480, partial [Stenotrophomonas maltophilia]